MAIAQKIIMNGAGMNLDLEELYNLINYVKDLNISEKLKKKILDNLIWKVTEINGKYEGVSYWSEEALKFRGKKKIYPKELRHEHVWTRKYLIRELLSGKSAKEMADKIVACIVTKYEHGLLKKDCEGWDRYKDTGVSVKKVSWN
ncbi:MAG: hypothetical protein AABY22_13680 [Nanoarchaeota archaeon]